MTIDCEIQKCLGSPCIIVPDVLLTVKEHEIDMVADSVIAELEMSNHEFYIGVSATPHTRFYDESIGHVHRGRERAPRLPPVPDPQATIPM